VTLENINWNLSKYMSRIKALWRNVLCVYYLWAIVVLLTGAPCPFSLHWGAERITYTFLTFLCSLYYGYFLIFTWNRFSGRLSSCSGHSWQSISRIYTPLSSQLLMNGRKAMFTVTILSLLAVISKNQIHNRPWNQNACGSPWIKLFLIFPVITQLSTFLY
jgi:hypothetical protein